MVIMKPLVIFKLFFQLAVILFMSSRARTTATDCLYPKLNAIPGNGWCSLRNIEMNPVFRFTYNKCQLLQTPTGNYLIPDHLHLTPRSTSDVDTSGELVDHYQKFVSITSRSMGATASGGYGNFHVAGSFSDEYRHMKKTQYKNKAVTTRVVGRYVLHSARFDEFAVELDEDLKVKLLDAIAALTVRNVTRASLILELAILSHGTHVITNIDLGGVIAKEDYISQSFFSNNENDQHGITISASIGYSDFFNVKASYNKSDYRDKCDEYVRNIVSTKISTYGGKLFEPTLNVSSWVESLPNYLVPSDRSGVPLPYIITPRHFPNVNQSILSALRREYAEAIKHFNDVNTHVGCIDQYASNFDYNANVGDKSCKNPPTNHSLGGLYQTCSCYWSDGSTFNFECSECETLVRKNVLTDDTNCEESFQPVFLNNKTKPILWKRCYTSWFFQVCWERYYIFEYKAYWCVAKSHEIPKNTGLMFGGVFTSTADNPVTGSKSCPPHYMTMKILQDLKVCISKDYEFGFKYAVPFGGFFSCKQGNPLATNTTLDIKFAKSTCADGYSQHLAAIDNDCLINYCVKANSFGSGGKELPIILPPFQNYDVIFAEENLISVLDGMSIAVIVLGTLLGLVIVGILSFVVYKKWQVCKVNLEDNESLIVNNDHQGYQSFPEK